MGRRNDWTSSHNWRLVPLNVNELLDDLLARGLARSAQSRTGSVRAVITGGIELAVSASSQERHLRARWRERVGSTGTPYLLVADHPAGLDGEVVALGPNSADGPLRLLNTEDLSHVIERASGMSALEAVRFVTGEVDRLDQTGIAGVKLKGLLTEHTLDVRLRGDTTRWGQASSIVEAVTASADWRAVLSALGYDLERRPQRGWLARHDGRPVVVVHPKADPADFARLGADGRPAEGVLISDCLADGARYGIMAHEGRLRLFDAQSATSTASWMDIDSALLVADDRPFLALLAPEYLAEGKLRGLQEEARSFGSGLRERLDETIRQSALPALAAGLGVWVRRQHHIDPTEDTARGELEKASLTLIFRLLFILYAESAGFLPMSNRTYRNVSLSSLVDEAVTTRDRLGSDSTALWSRYKTLVGAMRLSNPAWEVPAYNGALFAEDGFEGAELLEHLEIADPHFAQVLIAVGRDRETNRGVDYSTLEIGHLGHIYEALLSLRLSVAEQPLRYDPASDRYLPAPDSPEFDLGDLLWQTNEGGRKASGVYYTRSELVRHIVERAVLPAFDRHLSQVRTQAETDPASATQLLLEFSVLDPACGSAHFLVQVMERLAERTVLFLAETPLPAVADAIEELRAGATPGVAIDDVSLLRRLILKRCVYGVDLSPMGAEVATISLWLASFVPGLSLAYLGRNIVVGNSLFGVADPEKVGRHDDEMSASFMHDSLQSALAEAAEAVVRVGAIHDRTPTEYEESEQADADARNATEGVRRVFNLWTAEAFGLSGARHLVEIQGIEILDGLEGEFDDQAADLAKKHRFLHWPLEFPHLFSRDRPGFDVVVGNPPWEEVKPERLGFATLFRPGIQSLPEAERDQALDELFSQRPELGVRLEDTQKTATLELAALLAGGFEASSGDPDLYKFFCQRYRTFVRPGGLLGVVLPRSAFVNDGSEGFRRWLFERNLTMRVDFLVNRNNWIFKTHPQYTIALVIAERTPPPEHHEVEVAGTGTSLEEWKRQSAAAGLMIAREGFGPGWITPLLRSQEEADLLAKVRAGARFPFGSNGRWGCFPVRELDESLDKKLWRDATGGLPLWKGESFNQYDPHGAEERVVPPSPEVMAKVNGPRLRPGANSLLSESVPVSVRREAVNREVERARLAFRGIGRGTDSRTIIACLVPAHVLFVNSAPYLAFLKEDETAQAACLGIMNSLPFDWQARRFIEANVNFFLLEGLIVPALGNDDYSEISTAAARLSAVDDRFVDFARRAGVEVGPMSDAERQALRVDIDARVARGWKLTSADVELMLSDFTTDTVPMDYRRALLERVEELG